MARESQTESEQRSRRNIRLGSLGAALEYYDFVVYLFVATLLGAAFFPAGTSEVLRLVQTMSIFAIGYGIRPIAGILIARIADRVGRKRLFVLTVLVMSVATLVIGFLPTYAQIGWPAPVLLILLRIVQGSAVGAELPAAAVFVSEHAKTRGVARAGSFQQMLTFGGLLMGASVAYASNLIATHLTPGTPSLAWRLPFVVGGVLGLVAMYLRRKLEETPIFEAEVKDAGKVHDTPVRDVLRTHPGALLFAALVVAALVISNISYITFWPTYLQLALGFTPGTALLSSLIAISAAGATMPLWGQLADRNGWRYELLSAAGATVLGTALLLAVVPSISPNSSVALWIHIPAAVGTAGIIAVVPGLVSSVFPSGVRQTGYAISYNLVIAVLAGILSPVMIGLIAAIGPRAQMYVALVACAITVLNALVITRLPLYLGGDTARDARTPAASALGQL